MNIVALVCLDIKYIAYQCYKITKLIYYDSFFGIDDELRRYICVDGMSDTLQT